MNFESESQQLIRIYHTPENAIACVLSSLCELIDSAKKGNLASFKLLVQKCETLRELSSKADSEKFKKIVGEKFKL